MDLTYVLPVRIESADRLRNVITSVLYLLKTMPDAKVIVKEVDKDSVFAEQVIPVLEKHVSKEEANLLHVFEKSESDLFHKTRILNDLVEMAPTNIVCCHDVDVVYPAKSHIMAYTAIKEGKCDVVYPYGCGVYQYQVTYPQHIYEKFIASDFDIRVFKDHLRTESSTIGWTQFFRKKSLVQAGWWNENFISWGAEDCEMYYRVNALGYRVSRVEGPIWHMEHGRTHNSHYHNPKFLENHQLWQNIRTWDKNQLMKYYRSQAYVKGRFEKNVSH